MARILYVGTDEGAFILGESDAGGWQVESQALPNWSVEDLSVLPEAPNHVFAATRGDGVWTSDNRGEKWTKTAYGQPGPGKVHCLTLDPSNTRRLYAGCEPINIFVSDDQGETWQRQSSVRELPWVLGVDYPFKLVEPHVRDIVVDPVDPSTLYAALQVGAMLKSTNGGASWTVLSDGVDADIHTIAIHPLDPRKVYVASGGHDHRGGKSAGKALYASEDGGENWTPMAMEFSQEYSVPIVLSPGDPRVMYSALAHGEPPRWWRRETGAESVMIRSADGGKTWEPLTDGLAETSHDFPDAIEVDAERTDDLFAGFRLGGLWTSTNGGDSWQHVDAKLPAINAIRCVRV